MSTSGEDPIRSLGEAVAHAQGRAPAILHASVTPREIRKQGGLTQAQMASLLGMSLSGYRKWEQGDPPGQRPGCGAPARDPEGAGGRPPGAAPGMREAKAAAREIPNVAPRRQGRRRRSAGSRRATPHRIHVRPDLGAGRFRRHGRRGDPDHVLGRRVKLLLDPRLLRRGLLENGYEELAITGAHAVAVDLLPPIHRDPFDRILVAQAQIEGLALLTTDEIVARYPGPIRAL